MQTKEEVFNELFEACCKMIEAFDKAPQDWLMTHEVILAECFMKAAIIKAIEIKKQTIRKLK